MYFILKKHIYCLIYWQTSFVMYSLTHTSIWWLKRLTAVCGASWNMAAACLCPSRSLNTQDERRVLESVWMSEFRWGGASPPPLQRFFQVNLLLAPSWPGFFLSLTLGSGVSRPAGSKEERRRDRRRKPWDKVCQYSVLVLFIYISFIYTTCISSFLSLYENKPHVKLNSYCKIFIPEFVKMHRGSKCALSFYCYFKSSFACSSCTWTTYCTMHCCCPFFKAYCMFSDLLHQSVIHLISFQCAIMSSFLQYITQFLFFFTVKGSKRVCFSWYEIFWSILLL